jgi:hypothetical protein
MSEDTDKPIEKDLRHEDHEFNPAVEPKSAKAWINLLEESEGVFANWNDHCDRIDKLYASLERLSSMSRDKEFAMFWANCEVVKPSIYAKKPEPVVVPKFKDQRPVPLAASELAERCANVAFDLARINDLMLLVRDDVALNSRGVAWCRYESGKGDKRYSSEKICIDFKDRRDFLHSISRNWPEVTWVGAASYLTRGEARKRFHKHSGDEYQRAEYTVNRDAKDVGGADNRQRAKFWEIWDRPSQRVVWVAKGCEKILDEDDPHLDLTHFFPCPKPAYGTVQRGSLVPVPDVMQYRDQLDEINLLTGRIHALSYSLEAKGFYPAGGAELSEAVQAAVTAHTPGRMLVPISNWAAFGGSKEVIIWLPIDMIAQTITALVALRKQVIEDIYQIMGLADIMRGATDPNETLGAQQMKGEYGGKRIKDKQNELVRLARDLVEITIEVMFDEFDDTTIVEMSQTDLPTQAMVREKIMEVQRQLNMQKQQAEMLKANPQVQQMAQQNPEQAQQIMQQMEKAQEAGAETINQLAEKPTIEQVLKFLRDTRGRTFVLDIETDSTIQTDENAEKQRRTEFVGVLSTLLPQLAQMIAGEPKTAPFCGELLKFSLAPFRAGRSLSGAVDELVELMKQKGSQPPPNPEAEKLKLMKDIEMAKIEQKKQSDAAELKVKQDELVQKDKQHQQKLANDRAIAGMGARDKQQELAGKQQIQNEKLMQNRETHQAHVIEKTQDMELARQKADLAARQASQRSADMAQRSADQRAQAQFKMMQPPGGGRA